MRLVDPRGRRAPALAALGVTAMTVACSPGVSPTTEPASSSSTPTTSVTTPPSALTVVTVPDPTPGARTLLQAGPQEGAFRHDDVAAAAGEILFSLTCTGDGDVVVRYSARASLTYQCSAHQALTWTGPADLPAATTLDVAVETGPSITWALRLEQ